MSDKVLRTRRISNKGRANVIIALLRAEVKAWRIYEYVRQCESVSKAAALNKVIKACNRAYKAVKKTNYAGALDAGALENK